MQLEALNNEYPATRESLRALACFVLAPARKAVDGRIGLRASGDGFATPPFGERSRRVVVRGDHLIVEELGAIVARAPITTLRAAADLVAIELSADPGIGADLPAVAPDDMLTVDAPASEALGNFYALADMALVELRERTARSGASSEINLWPEHFDLAFDCGLDDERRANVGGSPGDTSSAEPYLYVGPWQRDSFARDEFWNADFGATLPYGSLLDASDPLTHAVAFFAEALARLELL